MKTYIVQIMNPERTVKKVKAKNIAEAVSKFRHANPDTVKGWSLMARTHHCPQVSWQFKRHHMKEELKQCKDEINCVWASHEEVKGYH